MDIKAKDLVLNTSDRSLSVNGKNVELSYKEFELLTLFIESEGRLLSKEQILQRVWNTLHRSDASVKKLVSELRKKIGDSVDEPIYIKTVGRDGYQWITPFESIAKEQQAPLDTVLPGLKSSYRKKLVTAALISFLILIVASIGYQPAIDSSQTSFRNKYLEKIDLPTSNIFEAFRSPDGNYLAYSQLNGSKYSRDLIIYDFKQKKVHLRIKEASPGAWSPDSSNLVYIDGDKGHCEFKILSLKDKNIYSLNRCGNYTSQPSAFWSSNEDEIYQFYSEQPESQIKLFKTNIKSGVTEHIISSSGMGFGIYFGTFGEDKNTIYILESDDFQRTSILEYKISERAVKEIHNVPYTLWSIAFDKNSIVYCNDLNGLDRLDLETGKISNILSSQLININAVTMDTTGELLLLAGAPFHIQIIKYNTGDFSHENITKGNKDQYPLYKNGKLYFTSKRTLAIQMYAYENGVIRKLTDFRNRLSLPVAYDVDENENFYIASSGGIFLNNKKIRSSGQSIHYHNGSIYFSDKVDDRFEIFVMKLTTNEVNRITFNGGYSAKVINGEIFFTKANLKGLWKLDKQGREFLFNNDFPLIKSSMNWFYTNNEIWAAEPESLVLYRLDIEKNIVTKSDKKIRGGIISGDGTSLYGTDSVLGKLELYNLKTTDVE